MIMLDTRQYDRSSQLSLTSRFALPFLVDAHLLSLLFSVTDVYYNTEFVHDHANDAGRSMTGTVQQQWLLDQLD